MDFFTFVHALLPIARQRVATKPAKGTADPHGWASWSAGLNVQRGRCGEMTGGAIFVDRRAAEPIMLAASTSQATEARDMDNDLTYARSKIAEALDTFDGDFDRQALLSHIMQALGDVDSEEFGGWRIERRIGSDFKGTRGAVRSRCGYIATHIETGHVEEFRPDSSGDVKIAIVRRMLETKGQLIELEKRQAVSAT